jgi:hypothetical protein
MDRKQPGDIDMGPIVIAIIAGLLVMGVAGIVFWVAW